MRTRIPQTALLRALGYGVALLCLLWPALYNGYPIVYSDTGTYISSGFKLDTPADRPITYGLFLWVTSLGGLTLWTTTVAHAVIVLWALRVVLDRICGRPVPRVVLFTTVPCLCLLTGLPWVLSQVMADVFTPLLLLSFIGLVIEGQDKRHRTGLFVLFVASAAMHLSHFPTVLAMALSLMLLRVPLRKSTGYLLRSGALALLAGLALAVVPIMGSALSKSRNIFFLGAMAEHGIAQEVLATRCATEDWALCAYRDSLPANSYEFVWSARSPVQLEGGWTAVNEEFGEIIRASLTDARFIWLHITASVHATGEQLLAFDIGDGLGRFGAGTTVHDALAAHVPGELDSFEQSRQFKEQLTPLNRLILLHRTALALALTGFVLLFRQASPSQRAAMILSLIAITMHAWTSGTFSGAIDRLGCRVAWLLPFFTIALATHRLHGGRNQNTRFSRT